jgi:hypothetical protein
MTRVLINYLYNIMVALSQLFNVLVLLGDPDESTSGKLGKSIVAGGVASKIPWPGFLKRHFIASIETDRGRNSAFKRDIIV